MNECTRWQECLEKYYAVKVTSNKAKARSLMETAEARIDFYKQNKLSELNINFIFEGYYSSALEIIHALVLLDSFKVENHICLGYYIRDVLKKDGLFRIFDDCRYKRNGLVYYGKRMNFDVAKESINKINILFNEIKKIVKTKL